MKNKKVLLSLLLCLGISCSAIAFGGCGGDNSSSSSASSSSTSSSESASESDTASDTTSDSMGGDSSQDSTVPDNGIVFKTLTVDGKSVFGKVSNATERFSFKEELTVLGEAGYEVALDEFGISTSLTKEVPLLVGENTFYVFETVGGDVVNTYMVSIYRNHLYTVTFEGLGIGQSIEEGELAALPAEQPTKAGYTFQKWDYDFNAPVLQNLTIAAVWEENINTVHFISNIGTLPSVQAKTGETITLSWYTDEEDFTLLGWSTTENGAVVYEPGASYTVGAESEQTLYAVIEQKTKSGFCWNIVGESIEITDYSGNATEISIPEKIVGCSVTSIGDRVFWCCGGLTGITIPDGVTSIGDHAFFSCYSLTSITIPESVTSIGNGAFACCSGLTGITVDENNAAYQDMDGNLYSKDGTTLLQYAIRKTDTAFIIPDGVTSIGDYAFSGCDSLTSIEIPDGVTSVGEGAFSGCDGLTSITIPESVTSIGERAFSNCVNLTSIEIPNSVISIGDYAFSGCDGLTSIEIPDGLTSITVDENNAAYQDIDGNLYSKDGTTLLCYPIGKTDTAFTIPDGVTSIGDYAFYICYRLTSIEIPDGVTSIGDWAFYYCSRLTSITIPDGVTSIGEYAFYNCGSLTSITFNGTVEEWNAIVKSFEWNSHIHATGVICSDGVVAL